ncbi:MAG: RNA methyltransferase [Acidiferrobacterales bacterium]|nr:RNA methyltransferase [Acidiferrobacterales bacterium]
MTALANIKVVLVRTFHPGNIGSAARSMKTMGLSNLCLVNPRNYPHAEVTKMAAGAADMLETVQLADSITEAISDCTVVIATTARQRAYDLPELSAQQAAQKLVHGAKSKPVALIFGPERMGLHNDDICHAKYRVTIAANPEYTSLNLAAAVQILSYEIFQTFTNLSETNLDSKGQVRDLPSSQDIERLYQHLQAVLTDIKFLRSHSGETMQRIRQLLTRAEPDVLETNILRGILSSIEKSLKGKQ